MSIPNNSFHVLRRGRAAQLRLRNLPIPDTFFFSNNVSIPALINADVLWEATSGRKRRGLGDTVPDDDPGAFIGHFAKARCIGRASGAETGFGFRTGRLTEDGFFAQLGRERNGSFL